MRDTDKTKAQLIQEIESLRRQLAALQQPTAANNDTYLENTREALLRSEERFYHVFRTSPIGISLSRLEDGGIVNANDSFLALLGWSRQDMIGKTAFELDMWSDRDQRRQMMGNLLKDGSVRDMELRYCTQQRELREVLASFDLIELDGITYVLGFHIDITGRKRAEKDLQRQLDENARLLEQANNRARELSALMKMSSALRQTSLPSRMLIMLIQETMSAMNANAAGIILPVGSSLLLSGLDFTGKMFQREITIPEDCVFLLNVLRQGTPLYLSSQDETVKAYSILHDLMNGMSAGGFVSLKAAGDTLGLLYVTYKVMEQDAGMSEIIPDDMRMLLEALSDVAGNALQRATTAELLEKRYRERSAHLAMLSDITSVASNPQELKIMLNQVLEKVLKAMRIPAGSIHVKEDDQDSLRLFVSKGLTAQDLKRYNLVSTRKAMWGEDIQQAKQPVQLDLARKPEFFGETFLESYSVFTSAPIRARGEMIGLLSVLRKADDTPSREDMGLLMTVADQIGVIVENDRLRKKAEEAAVTEERQRLSRELHDSVNQLLYSLALFARGGLNYAQSAQWNQVSRSLQDINDTAQQALKEMRLMLFEMRPDSLQQAGLVEALRYRLEAVERRAGVAAQLVAEEPLNLPPEAENELYRVAQEALNNALKHAFAKKVTVHLFPTADNKVKLEIIDDGNGFDPSTVSGGMGLNTMRERIVRLGGILSITSVKGQGTRVLAELNGYPPAVGVG